MAGIEVQATRPPLKDLLKAVSRYLDRVARTDREEKSFGVSIEDEKDDAGRAGYIVTVSTDTGMFCELPWIPAEKDGELVDLPQEIAEMTQKVVTRRRRIRKRGRR